VKHPIFGEENTCMGGGTMRAFLRGREEGREEEEG